MRTDWEKIKAAFMRSGMDLTELAVKHHVSYSTLSKRAAKERWIIERGMQADRIRKRVNQRREERAANRLSSIMEELEEAAAALRDKINLAVTDDEQLYKHEVIVIPNDDGDPRSIHVKKLDTKAVLNITESIKLLNSMASAAVRTEDDSSGGIIVTVEADRDEAGDTPESE